MHKVLGYSLYTLDSVKITIQKRQKRNALDLSKITKFNKTDDLVDVACTLHKKEFEEVLLWYLMQGRTPCEECRAELIGIAQYSPWEETEKEMRKVERRKHITYFPFTYKGRLNDMLKHCNKDGHGFFEQAPKLTIRQHSSCPDCATSGFKMSKPAYAYLLRYSYSDQNIGIRYKQGVMNKKRGLSSKSDKIQNEDVKYRIRKLKSSVNKFYLETKVDIMDWVYFELGADAKAVEDWFKARENIRWLSEHKFEGFTEMYTGGIVEIWKDWKGKFENSSDMN
jgi:hypothetical protein